ncbi:hypothetical protein AWJ20_1804 [Sugiyamaella lignohabitans]|uniref:Anaphase-promoting complex subunit 4 WD40 domain-containing protein n=1 Tax=Sugiyamaella lignohabitans TaxID=796027 RepID=A0A167E0N0_9ASCO|nr:uncharacterized protein AWJ20_1804 [Sugiyamaella lignohabitans]ANB13510.1 hypothetical protein AWJ20_1804 [Sugiyamaella lignohabitans]
MVSFTPLETQSPLLPEQIPTAFQSSKSLAYKVPYLSGLIIRKALFNNTGTKLALTHNDRHIRIWPVDQPDSKASFELRVAHDRPVEDISWDPLHADRFASCSTDGYIKIWDSRTKKCVRDTKVDGEILVIKYSTDGRHISVGLRSDLVIVFTNQLQQVASYQESDEVYDLAWSNGSDILAISLGNGNVRLLNFVSSGNISSPSSGANDETNITTNLSILHTLRGNRTATSCIEFDPIGRYLAVGSNEGIVSLWDTKEWICVKTFSKVDQPVTSVSFSHDGSLLAIASDSNAPINIVWLDNNEYIYSIHPNKSFLGRPNVDWHPLRFALAYTGEPYSVITITK